MLPSLYLRAVDLPVDRAVDHVFRDLALILVALRTEIWAFGIAFVRINDALHPQREGAKGTVNKDGSNRRLTDHSS